VARLNGSIVIGARGVEINLSVRRNSQLLWGVWIQHHVQGLRRRRADQRIRRLSTNREQGRTGRENRAAGFVGAVIVDESEGDNKSEVIVVRSDEDPAIRVDVVKNTEAQGCRRPSNQSRCLRAR